MKLYALVLAGLLLLPSAAATPGATREVVHASCSGLAPIDATCHLTGVSQGWGVIYGRLRTETAYAGVAEIVLWMPWSGYSDRTCVIVAADKLSSVYCRVSGSPQLGIPQRFELRVDMIAAGPWIFEAVETLS